MITFEVQKVPVCTLGEGPFWDAATRSLLYVDIKGEAVHRLWTATGRHQRAAILPSVSGSAVTFIIGIEGRPEEWLVGVGRTVGLLLWGAGSPDDTSLAVRELATVDQDRPKNRLNDAKCDPEGRLWAGTMGQEIKPAELELAQGSVYRFDESMNAVKMFSEVDLSNGLAWSTDEFYYIDTCKLSVDAFKYEPTSGNICDRRQIIHYRNCKENLEKDVPDGMAIDTEGRVWVANYFGGKILCVEPSSGQVVQSVALPCRCPTSVCWGGPDLDQLFVTSSRNCMDAPAPEDGCLLKIVGLGVKGLLSQKAKLNAQ